ncbi:MAG TPA: phenylacetate--CoA ligase [Ktedonobacteraceae bacterium]|nr:phenylacetate--CoA ligase [Ktedonobacteraceae bacterium]
MIRYDEIEWMNRDELTSLQIRGLQAFIRRIKKTVPFYQTRLHDIDPEDITDLADFQQLPMTTKSELRKAYPFGMLGTSLDQVAEVHATSGTTGSAVVMAYTPADLKLWGHAMGRGFSRAGVGRGDLVHNAYGYGLFTGGLGVHYGALEVGATVLPISGGNTQRQVTLLRDLGATVLCCTPSYALHIAETMREMQVSAGDLQLRVGTFGAEAWSEGMCREIESVLGIAALDLYGLAEIIGPGVASECLQGREGLHVAEDLFFPEIIDPATGQVVEPGQAGELVLTSMLREATPVLRYRTGDITRMIPGKCACGRTSLRIAHLQGRVDDMFTLRGINLFPREIETILLQIDELAPHYQLVVDRQRALDVLEIHVEPRAGNVSAQELAGTVKERLWQTLGFHVEVRVCDPHSIPRSEGKAVRLVDRRQLMR